MTAVDTTYQLRLSIQLRGVALPPHRAVHEGRVVYSRRGRSRRGVVHDADFLGGDFGGPEKNGQEQLCKVEVADDVHSELEVVLLSCEQSDGRRHDTSTGSISSGFGLTYIEAQTDRDVRDIRGAVT